MHMLGLTRLLCWIVERSGPMRGERIKFIVIYNTFTYFDVCIHKYGYGAFSISISISIVVVVSNTHTHKTR